MSSQQRISGQSDYYPFGMLMPGRYTSDTSLHCVTSTQTVMVSKPITTLVEGPVLTVPVLTYQFGQPTPVPTIGSLPVASAGFSEEVLHIYHYLDAVQHPNGWIAQSEVGEGNEGLNYDVDLSDEPTGISTYMHLHLDTANRTESFSFELELATDVGAEVRVRQYKAANSEEYEDAVGWTTVDANTIKELSLPVNKTAIAAGGKTVVEWIFHAPGGISFASNTLVKIKKPQVIGNQWVAENRVITTCEEKDEYRFGFNTQEKVNEIAGKGNHYTALFWEYDARLGRRWNLDPVDQIGISNYAANRNNPILFCDPLGDYSKIGATWRNAVHGGEGVVQSKANPKNGNRTWGYKTKDEAGYATVHHFGSRKPSASSTTSQSFLGAVKEFYNSHSFYMNDELNVTLGVQAGVNVNVASHEIGVEANAINMTLLKGQIEIAGMSNPAALNLDYAGENGYTEFSHSAKAGIGLASGAIENKYKRVSEGGGGVYDDVVRAELSGGVRNTPIGLTKAWEIPLKSQTSLGSTPVQRQEKTTVNFGVGLKFLLGVDYKIELGVIQTPQNGGK